MPYLILGSTYRLESGDLAGLSRDVVDEDTTLRLSGELVVELQSMAQLGHTLVSAVASLEVKVGGPVVAEVLACIGN